ncbi:hypothetical protein HanPSC8_Chr03g0105871 [Helianthus annuus]|nr:hypothetical protein HanPSC8_Chr03g0105871 [Helianthus annuus]
MPQRWGRSHLHLHHHIDHRPPSSSSTPNAVAPRHPLRRTHPPPTNLHLHHHFPVAGSHHHALSRLLQPHRNHHAPSFALIFVAGLRHQRRKKKKNPAAPTIERPVRQRKSVERLVAVIKRDNTNYQGIPYIKGLWYSTERNSQCCIQVIKEEGER